MKYPALIIYLDDTTHLGYIDKDLRVIKDSVTKKRSNNTIHKICHDINGKYEEYYPNAIKEEE